MLGQRPLGRYVTNLTWSRNGMGASADMIRLELRLAKLDFPAKHLDPYASDRSCLSELNHSSRRRHAHQFKRPVGDAAARKKKYSIRQTSRCGRMGTSERTGNRSGRTAH